MGQSFSAMMGETQPTPKLYYMPLAGRGELIKLIAAAGDLEMETVLPGDDFDKAPFGSPGSLPVFEHGDLKLAQSGAIESYVSSIAPKFSGLTAQQKAKDCHFCCIKEDLLAATAKEIFSTKDAANIKAAFDKWLTVIEGMLPAEGFVHGLDFPTPADLVLVIIKDGFMPFGAALKLAGGDYDFTKYPKFLALYEKTKASEAVKTYLEKTDSMAGNPMGF
ncbi:hypothetical protein CYMTET_21802 [Cymbomonas tetramitiformis]|uniref:Glutathione S-transferase n=1 Tax=Cymbomonas tetramitiformis TaxID=36881 RepID=A0AAE0G1H0_9CHLO|nr:hypothetical protein CYMTET_21802 [Cymbomonas tetramitiformis]|eukprot:gene19005-22721_t